MNNTPQVTKPLLRGHFHQGMFFVGLGALIPLLFRTHSLNEFIAILIYAVCGLTMFGVSTLYHRVTWSQERRLLWKKMDHAGIYLMIAGSFTPIALLALPESSGKILLAIIWGVAAVGILQSIFFVNVPKYVSSIIYLIAGYLIVPYIGELKISLGILNVWLMFLGGIAYSIGAICYALKWPQFNPKYFGYHEVFHIFVNIGAIFHFFVISSLIN
jgi:hemolysin III